MSKKHLLALALLAGCAGQAELPPVRLILVGDSTLAPNNGYGDALCARLKPQVACLNVAKNGRSSGSFRAEGLWDAKVLAALADKSVYKTSYVLIEFGHNDQPGKPGRSTDLKTEFPVNIARYVDEVRAAGGTPLLATPLTRRSFDSKDGHLQNDLQPWADTTKRIAAEKQVPLIDLLAASGAAVQAMGQAEADTLAVEPPPKAPPAEPVDRNQLEKVTTAKSAFDRTHVGAKGAKLFAAMVERLMRDSVPALAPYFQ